MQELQQQFDSIRLSFGLAIGEPELMGDGLCRLKHQRESMIGNSFFAKIIGEHAEAEACSDRLSNHT
jgi:hypothetical protein